MRQIPRALGAALTVPALLLASACGGSGTQPGGGTQPGQLKVVTAFYPLQYAAERVAGSDAKIENLTQPGAEAHDLELSPKQIAALSDADVVVYLKGFQPAVDKAIEQAKPKKVVDMASVVKMHPTTKSGEHDHEHGDEHGEDETATPGATDEHGGEEHEEHDHGGVDPHAWLDPNNMGQLTHAVGAAFGEARPEKRDAFTQNAEAAEKDLKSLDDSFKAALKNCKRREFVTSHQAFGYLAEAYGLKQIGIRGLSPDEEPSPARIAEVQKLAKEHGVTTIFYEQLVSPAVSESLARDLQLKTDVLDPLEGLTDKSKGKNYVEVMQSNLKSLQAANECA
ncbi:metal ABC transporter substrate-binding protein [Mariniluteicoccus endophyticus]